VETVLAGSLRSDSRVAEFLLVDIADDIVEDTAEDMEGIVEGIEGIPFMDSKGDLARLFLVVLDLASVLTGTDTFPVEFLDIDKLVGVTAF
jgi:hypothetical protein